MRWLSIAVLSLCLTVPALAPAFAHAIIMSSTPGSNATVTTSDLPVQLKYNSRVDHKRSVVKLLGPGDKVQVLPISDKSTEDTLVTSIAGLTEGKYKLRWQVLSVDGHITRGDIPFTYVPAGSLGGPIPVPAQ